MLVCLLISVILDSECFSASFIGKVSENILGEYNILFLKIDLGINNN